MNQKKPNSSHSVLQFIRRVRRRLNRHSGLHGLLWALLLVAATVVVMGLGYVVQGYQVPWRVYPVAGVTVVLLAVTLWFLWRADEDQAAHVADQTLGLKDSLRSCRNFMNQGLTDGLYALQARQTEQKLGDQTIQAIRLQAAPALIWSTLVLTLLALALAFKGPSPTIVAEEELRRALLESTDSINEELKELIDELELAVSDENERELLNANNLREWVKELEATGDPREAMRQYAKLERKIEQAAQALQNRRDEQLLERAAAELKKDSMNRDLADLLKQKQFDKAAKELDKLKLKPSERKPGMKLSDKQKELAKLRAASQRMGDVVREKSGQTRDSRNPNRSNNRDQNRRHLDPDGKMREPNELQLQEPGREGDQNEAENEAEEMDGELAKLMEELDEEVRKWEEAMQELEVADGDEQDREGDGERIQARINEKLDQMGQQMRRLARQRAAQDRLRALAQKFGQAQGRMPGRSQGQAEGQMQGESDQPGGREAGRGTSDRQRLAKDNPETKGHTSRLQGIHGRGPSLTQIQSADSGTGVSSRTGEAVQRDFQRQFESFVEREDIPEDLKAGVKNYFLQIHQSAADESTEDVPPGNQPSGEE